MDLPDSTWRSALPIPAIINGPQGRRLRQRTDCTHTLQRQGDSCPHEPYTGREDSTARRRTMPTVHPNLREPGKPRTEPTSRSPSTNADGTFNSTTCLAATGVITVFDQWTDLILDGYTPHRSAWTRRSSTWVTLRFINGEQNLYTRTFFDLNGDGVSQDNEPGLISRADQHPVPRRQLLQLQQH